MLGGCFSFAWMGELTGQLAQLGCDWRIIALARSFLAFTFALSLARLSGAQLVLWKPRALWWRSIAGSVSLLCTFFALTQVRPSEVLTLTNTFPIWVALLSWPLLRVRPSLSTWIAAGCGVLGVFVMQQPHLETATFGQKLAAPLALFAAFSSAVAMLGLNRLKGLDPWAIVTHFSGVATLFVLAAWIFSGPVPVEQLLNPDIAARLLGVGVSATIGQMCLTQAFTTGEPSRVSVVGLTQIVFALGLDLAFGGQPFNLVTLAGMALVMAPTAWVMAADRPAE
jgi:drug/metabolite transporter (DMT)-like permease